MSLTITLSADVEAAIRSVADEQGRSPSDVANDTLWAQYVGDKPLGNPTPEGQLALEAPRHTLLEADLRHRLKYGLPELSTLTPDELSEYAEKALLAADPARVAEAQRAGII